MASFFSSEKKKKPTDRHAHGTVLWSDEIHSKHVGAVGEKNVVLSQVGMKFKDEGILVPRAFVLTQLVYHTFLRFEEKERNIKQILKEIETQEKGKLNKRGKDIRDIILKGKFPIDLEREIIQHYRQLSRKSGETQKRVAVRPSFVFQEKEFLFPQSHNSFLFVRGEKELVSILQQAIASLFSDENLHYCLQKGIDPLSFSVSLAVQEMISAEKGASGFATTIDPESGSEKIITLTAAYGVGVPKRDDRLLTDHFVVFKEGLKQKKAALIEKRRGLKEVKWSAHPKGGLKEFKVPTSLQQQFCLTDKEILHLSELILKIENFYKQPQYVEWVKDDKTGKFYFVEIQSLAHTETVPEIENYFLKKQGKVLLTGITAVQKIGVGPVRVLSSQSLASFRKGDVLVASETFPEWESIMKLASAVITETGSHDSHAALVCRELGIPCVVGAKGARRILKNGKSVTVDGTAGNEGKIYGGALPFEMKSEVVEDIKKTKTQVMINMGNPAHALSLARFPADGVGLARLEFIFREFIRIHPLAFLHFSELKNRSVKNQISEMTIGYKNKADFCVDRLAESIARMAVAFYPRPVHVRFSDFTSEQYGELIGGREFEKKEKNPFLGNRGASRYISQKYREAFQLECRALKKVREEWGLENVIPVVPFCRTPEEGEEVLKVMAGAGLKRGEKDLHVYVTCEIPSNVILAEAFAQLFDGFFIDAHDFTQMILGVDLESTTHPLYTEKNKAIKQLVKDIIQVAHRYKRKIGMGTSYAEGDREYIHFLLQQGIDSITVSPDVLVPFKKEVASIESTVGRTGNKTHTGALGFLFGIAMVMAGFMVVGAGCGNTENAVQKKMAEVYVAPGELRQQLMKRIENEQKNHLMAQQNVLQEKTFSHFSLHYPALWSVDQWSGGVSLQNENGDAGLSIFHQLVSHPVVSSTPLLVGGKEAKHFVLSTEDGKNLEVVEMKDGDEILEMNFVNVPAETVKDIVQSFSFLSDEETQKPTHWDVRERRLCVPMVTQARKNAESSCQAFARPCDIPKGWEVCDAGLGEE